MHPSPQPGTRVIGEAGASTRTVERALSLLSAVCESESITLAECARTTGLAPSTALRLLRTLEGAGFAERNRDGAYRAGTKMIRLGAATFGRQSLVRLAEPALREVAAATGESVYLNIPGPRRTAVYVAMIEGSHPIRHTSWVGRTIGYDGLALGEVLDGRTPPSGYVAERDRTEPDVTAIAAPILRPGGIAGALSLLGPTYRIDDDAMARYGDVLAAAAADLSRQLGVRSTEREEVSP